MDHLVLTGFMAVGKTAVGKRLARRLGRDFIDTDNVIEKREGMSIREIFDNRGESEFRRVEREVVSGLDPDGPCVISTGGGTFVDERNREALRRLGVVVCLVTSIETVIERAGRGGKRPLASGASRDQLEKLYNERMESYRHADVLVETDGLTLDQSVARVLKMIEPRLKRGDGSKGEREAL
jgi:shikimate kinase